MLHLKTLADYCKAIKIPAPRHNQFDIRSFQENMPFVVATMPPFRHEFYSIALKKSGSGHAITGQHQTSEDQHILFFNSPYQILSWDILPDWEGYYIMFTKAFLSKSTLFKNLLLEFPFLRMDKAVPLPISESDFLIVEQIFQNIYQEYQQPQTDQIRLIQAQTYLLLNYVKRFVDQENRTATKLDKPQRDLQLVSRFQSLIEFSLNQERQYESDFNPHTTSFYAKQLHIHPNYLNSIVKEITGQTALKLLHRKLFEYSQSFLLQTTLSIKEIAYLLYFKESAHFTNFFKKYAKKSPKAFRESPNI